MMHIFIPTYGQCFNRNRFDYLQKNIYVLLVGVKLPDNIGCKFIIILHGYFFVSTLDKIINSKPGFTNEFILIF